MVICSSLVKSVAARLCLMTVLFLPATEMRTCVKLLRHTLLGIPPNSVLVLHLSDSFFRKEQCDILTISGVVAHGVKCVDFPGNEMLKLLHRGAFVSLLSLSAGTKIPKFVYQHIQHT